MLQGIHQRARSHSGWHGALPGLRRAGLLPGCSDPDTSAKFLTGRPRAWIPDTWLVAGLFFGVALLDSSVGFGGASSYLAVIRYFKFPHETSATIALTLNAFVATIAFFNYHRCGHFRGYLLWLSLITSIPAAFIGGSIHINHVVYWILLNVILLYVAV